MSVVCFGWNHEENLASALCAALNSGRELAPDCTTTTTNQSPLGSVSGSLTIVGGDFSSREQRDALRLRLDRSVLKMVPRPDTKDIIKSVVFTSDQCQVSLLSSCSSSVAVAPKYSLLTNQVFTQSANDANTGMLLPIKSFCDKENGTNMKVSFFTSDEVASLRKKEKEAAVVSSGNKREVKSAKLCTSLLCSTPWSPSLLKPNPQLMKRCTSLLPPPQYHEVASEAEFDEILISASKHAEGGNFLFTSVRGIELNFTVVALQDIYLYLALRTKDQDVDSPLQLCARIQRPYALDRSKRVLERSCSERSQPSWVQMRGTSFTNPLFLGAHGPVTWLTEAARAAAPNVRALCHRFSFNSSQGSGPGPRPLFLECMDIEPTDAGSGKTTSDSVELAKGAIIQEALTVNNKWAQMESAAYECQKLLQRVADKKLKQQKKVGAADVEGEEAEEEAESGELTEAEETLRLVKSIRWILQCSRNNQDVNFTTTTSSGGVSSTSGGGGKKTKFGGGALSFWDPKALCPKPIPLGTVATEDESTTVEFKEALVHDDDESESTSKGHGGDNRKKSSNSVERIRQTIAAMASTQGGNIVVGVNDASGAIVGTEHPLRGKVRTTGFYPALQVSHVQVSDVVCEDGGSSSSTADGSATTTVGAAPKLAKDWWKGGGAKKAPVGVANSTVSQQKKKFVSIITVEPGAAPFYTTGKLGSSITQWPMMRGFASTLPMSTEAVNERILHCLQKEQGSSATSLNSASLKAQGTGSTLSDLVGDGPTHKGEASGRASTSSSLMLEDGSIAVSSLGVGGGTTTGESDRSSSIVSSSSASSTSEAVTKRQKRGRE